MVLIIVVITITDTIVEYQKFIDLANCSNNYSHKVRITNDKRL